MSIQYTTGGKSYNFDYQEMKKLYNQVCLFPEEIFIERLKDILHLACTICYFKGLSLEETLGDEGVIHQIAHLMDIPEEPIISVTRVRELFEYHCKLA